MFSHYFYWYKQYDVNKREKETPFSEKTVKFREISSITVTDYYLFYKELKSPYNFFLIFIVNELFKFKTSEEWQH